MKKQRKSLLDRNKTISEKALKIIKANNFDSHRELCFLLHEALKSSGLTLGGGYALKVAIESSEEIKFLVKGLDFGSNRGNHFKQFKG